MSQSQLNGLYIFGGITLAMMANSAYIRYTERKKEEKRTDELLAGVTERPVYNETMYYRHSIGGLKKTKKQKIKR
jgi:hypothetical protein